MSFIAQSAFQAGRDAWNEFDLDADVLEFPKENPFGDEFDNAQARDFRKGFNAAARQDGYSYSRVTGEYCESGEGETDERTSLSEQREWS